VADTSFAGESAAILAEHQARLQIQVDVRKRAARRSAAGAAVAVVHVIFVLLLIAAEWIPLPLVKPDKQQPLSWIVLPQIAKATRVPPVKPLKPADSGVINPYVVPQFIRPPQEEENNAITDLGWALGRSLACGANSYEYLNSKMRNECKHRPWQFVYDRYGNIVLDAVPRIPHEEKPRPSDVQAHERNTAPRCPQNVDPNAPCLANVIGGRP
jgi:hypothetical protein